MHKMIPGGKKCEKNPRKRIFFSRMSFFHMGYNIIVLFWSILHQVQQDIKVPRRLVYAKVAFRTDGQQVIYVKFEVSILTAE